jgi:hypothetical protein
MEGTTFSLHSTARPEGMADVPGVCELPLTRAVVHYRDLHEVDPPGGRIQDIGLALVLEGRFASSSEVLDLGSSTVKMLDLSSELVVLDWVYEPTLKHVNRLLMERARGDESDAVGRLGTYSFQMALSLIGRIGYGPLTRPTILRIGFRDICRDLDFHEGTAVRIVLGEHRVARAHLYYDANSLVFSTPSPEPDAVLESGVLEAFPHSEVLRVSEAHNGGSVQYQVRLSFPASLAEAREELRTIRRGLGALLARFEPDRFQALEHHLTTFGSRDTLSQLHVRERRTKVEALRTHHGAAGGTVH